MFSKPLTLCSLKRYREIDNTNFPCVYVYLYQELVQTFSFRKKNIFASFERVCLQTLACLALARPVRSSREESQKYEEGVLGQAESSQTLSPPTALRGYFSDSMCISPSVRLSGRRKGCLEIQDICSWLQNKPSEILSGWSFQNTIESELYWFVLGSILPPSVQF